MSLTLTFALPERTVTSVRAVAMSLTTGACHAGVFGSLFSSSQPVSPGAGHQAVEFSPSTAAVRERAGLAPPKASASAAEEEARTVPRCETTFVSGPAEG